MSNNLVSLLVQFFVYIELNVKPALFQLFHTIQFGISTQFVFFFFCTQLNVNTVLFQTIYISVGTWFRSISPIHMILPDATTVT